MFIQIDNVGFVNKGAELMLRSIIDRLKSEQVLQPKFVKGLNFPGSHEQIMSTGLFQFFDLQRYKIKWQNHFKQNQLTQYGLVKSASIDVILDAGGFQFGDQLNKYYTDQRNKQLKEYYHQYKNNGSKIIFLPQAFGPFELPLAVERIKIAYEMADLIYAREKTSYEHLVNLFGPSDRIRLAPDFTSLISPDIPLRLYEKVKGGVCLIPNARMMDKTSREVADAYLDFLLKMTEFILDKGEKLILLNHEGEGDWQLINKILNNFKTRSENIVALNNLNALEVKAAIGHCKLLISSRFHGVVSGLNQQIPTFCTSWSHKYEELLADYEVSDNLLDATDIVQSLETINKALIDADIYLTKDDIIEKYKIESKEMWIDIIRLIQG